MSFEAQAYYDDIRRWMDLPEVMSGKIMGIIPQVTTDLVNYPTGFKYERTEIENNQGIRQPSYREGMYYLPFLNSDILKMKEFVNNPAW
jgi:hypothetical protein